MLCNGVARFLQLTNISTHSKCICIVPRKFATIAGPDPEQLKVDYPPDWHQAKPFEAIPGPTPLPLIGDTWRFLGGIDFLRILKSTTKQYGSIVKFKKLLAFGEMLFITDVNDIEWMLRNEGPWPMRETLPSSTYYRHTLRKEKFGDTMGLINGQNEQWSSFRTHVNPIMMQPRTTHHYIPLINDIADEFIVRVRKLKAQSAIGELPKGFIDELNKWAFESVTAIAFDTRLGCLHDEPSAEAQKSIRYILEILQLMLPLDFLPIGAFHRKYNTRTWRRFIECQDYFTNMTLKMIDEANERIRNDPEYANKPEHEKSVFEKLVATDKKIALVMILDMLGAGIDTTAKVTGGTLYFLAKNVNAQQKLREELQRLLPHKTSPITKAVLGEAKYLRACIKEALRLAPISIGTFRRTTKPVVVGGYQVPAGVVVALPTLYASLEAEHKYDMKEYVPERWLRGENTEKIHPFLNIPFGFGARSCIGMRMATMEIEVLTCKMVRNFAMEWHHRDMRFKQELLYGIGDPLKIRLGDLSQ